MKSRKWWLLASFIILLSVIVIIAILEDIAQVEEKDEPQYLPPISIVNPQSQDNKGIILTYAEIKPRWATTLKAHVSGEIEHVFDQALAGERVKKGDLLIQIEDSRYEADLYEAEQALAEAKLNLLQAQKKSSQAQRDWKRSGIDEKPSDLVLHIPQLEVAEKSLSAAEGRLNAAKKTHSYTRIRAPFSGIIITRNANIGQTVLEGEELLHIVQEEQQEIAVTLSKQQWDLLAKDWKNRSISIRNTAGAEIAQAHIKRGGGFLDPETRQYMLFLEIDDESNSKTLVGDFVQVNLAGRVIPNSLAIPESALTRNGTIWYLDDEDRLRQFAARVLFYQNDQIVIETPSHELLDKHYPSHWRIATTPLASFLTGHRVEPMMVGGE